MVVGGGGWSGPGLAWSPPVIHITQTVLGLQSRFVPDNFLLQLKLRKNSPPLTLHPPAPPLTTQKYLSKNRMIMEVRQRALENDHDDDEDWYFIY